MEWMPLPAYFCNIEQRVAFDLHKAHGGPGLYFGQIDGHTQKIKALEKKLQALAKNSGTAKLLQTIPGLGPITAIAIEAFAPAMATFKRRQDFAAWLGLVPKQHSTGGKTRLGKTSKAGQRDIRRLLIIGATTVIWWARKKGAPRHPWLEALLARKAPLVAAVALANKMARTVWAMLTKGKLIEIRQAWLCERSVFRR